MPRITPFSHQNKSVSQKTMSVSGFAMPKTAGFTPVERSGPAKRIWACLCRGQLRGSGSCTWQKKKACFGSHGSGRDLWRLSFVSDFDIRNGIEVRLVLQKSRERMLLDRVQGILCIVLFSCGLCRFFCRSSFCHAGGCLSAHDIH